ncbi:MAG: hypothetical protein HYT62_03335 [Candidatus Yanofskybacteria bacterium]|nr:hypothetical protein [Candidatus Yanofskybacteria bacterium]
MTLRFNLLWKEIFLFGFTLLVGIFSAYNLALVTERSTPELQVLSWSDIIIFLALFAVLSLVLLKFKRLSGLLLKIFLVLVIFSGSQIVFSSLVSSPWDLAWALGITAFFILIHNVLTHNIAVLMGIAGVSSLLGVTISPEVGILFLIVLSFYDILAVYWTKHMVYLARGMIESGAVFGFIIPFDIKDVFYHKDEARGRIGEKFMVLGSGDIGLPLIMVSSVAVISIWQAIIVSLFSLIGLFLTHLIFVNQENRKPMAALPPIATMTIIGYLISFI